MFADTTLRRPPLHFPIRTHPDAPAAEAQVRAPGDRSRGAIEAGLRARGHGANTAGTRRALPLGATWELIGLRALYGQ